jgi:hypothetical protein
LDTREKIIKCREVLRYHRDQIGDDRCFLDDYKVYKVVAEITEDELLNSIFRAVNIQPPVSLSSGMKLCEKYYETCRSDEAPVVPEGAILDPVHWDDDLGGMSEYELLITLDKIIRTVLWHAQFIDRSRTKYLHQALYNLLPEKLPADFRLPSREEFLGYASPAAGCPRFWLSHVGCGASCDLHKWGPCQ